MKIYGLDNEIVVDSIPFVYEPNRKIFLTSLTHIETHTLPKVFPKIYTSEVLKKQFILYLKNKNIEIEDDNFHVWKPFQPEMITLTNGTCYEILPCCPKDSSTSILLVFRQGLAISHIYVGCCSDLRSTVVNMKLVSWLRKGANTALYAPTSKACKRCVDCELRKAMKKIEKKLNSNNLAKLLIQLPLFGSEVFITEVASQFRGYVAICGLLKEMYMTLPSVNLEHFTEDFRSARIIITAHDTSEFLSTSLKREKYTVSKKYPVKWSPLPSSDELNLLSVLVQPSQLYDTKFKDFNEVFVQISSVFYDANQTSRQLSAQSIKRQSVHEDQCCLEKSQSLDQQVIEKVKIFLNQTTSSELIRKDNQTVVDLTESTPTEQIPNNTTNLSENTAQNQEIPQEIPQQQCENQEETAKKRIERDKQTPTEQRANNTTDVSENTAQNQEIPQEIPQQQCENQEETAKKRIERDKQTPTEQRANNTTDVSENTTQDQEILQETPQQQCENHEETSERRIERNKQTPTEKRANNTTDVSENTSHGQEKPQNNCENQPHSTETPKETAKRKIERNKSNKSKAEQTQESDENQPTKFAKRGEIKYPKKSSYVNKKSTKIVYRQGKKGIRFVDDDSSSSC